MGQMLWKAWENSSSKHRRHNMHIYLRSKDISMDIPLVETKVARCILYGVIQDIT